MILKTVVLFAVFASCYSAFMPPRYTLNNYSPSYTNCGQNDTNFDINGVTFDSPPSLGHNSTMTITGKSINNGFTTGSFSLSLKNSGQSVLTDGTSLNQTHYPADSNYTFQYNLALSSFIPSGNYQLLIQLNQPETFPENEITCINITFSAF